MCTQLMCPPSKRLPPVRRAWSPLVLLVQQQHAAERGAKGEARQRGARAVQAGPALQQAARLVVGGRRLGVLLAGGAVGDGQRLRGAQRTAGSAGGREQ